MITVIIPFYNSEKFLERCLASCLAQKELSQIVLIDDASTDDGLRIVKIHQEKNSEIQIDCISNKANLGPGVSRNEGLKRAINEYVIFLDSDDYFLPNRFGDSLEMLKANANIDGVYAPMREEYDEEPKHRVKEIFELALGKGERVSVEDALSKKEGSIHHGGILFRKSFLNKKEIRYHSGKTAEDLDLLFRSLHEGNIVYLNQVLTIRSIHNNNLIFNIDWTERHAMDKKWFTKMLDSNFSKKVNLHFYRNYVLRKPFYKDKQGLFWRGVKGIDLALSLITKPKLWTKVI